MTVTGDPHHPAYIEEADARGEMTRVFDVCNGCRRCISLCPTFPSLFDLIEAHTDGEAGRLTPEQQDRVVAQCSQCSLCSASCPYTPDRHELQIDFPRLMLRATAMRRANGHGGSEVGVGSVRLRTDLVGRWATRCSGAANRLIGAAPGSFPRRLLTRFTGVSAIRRLPSFAGQRFSTWLRTRGLGGATLPSRQRVAVFPTCVVEYQLPGIGRDLVRVYERNGIECISSGGSCCGAPWLQAGNVKRFTKIAMANVSAWAPQVRSGLAIVVPEPSCHRTIQREYPRHVGSADAELVAANTFDASEYLVGLHVGERDIDRRFEETLPERVTVYGASGAELLSLAGASVRAAGAGIGDTNWWGMQSGNEATAIAAGRKLLASVAADDAVFVSDSAFMAFAVAEHTGHLPTHPLQLLARAYGEERDEQLDSL